MRNLKRKKRKSCKKKEKRKKNHKVDTKKRKNLKMRLKNLDNQVVFKLNSIWTKLLCFYKLITQEFMNIMKYCKNLFWLFFQKFCLDLNSSNLIQIACIFKYAVINHKHTREGALHTWFSHPTWSSIILRLLPQEAWL